MSTDTRLCPGAHVHSLACRVLRPNDAKQKLGTAYKTKHLDGRVIKVHNEVKNGRNYKYITCVFLVGSQTKMRSLPLSSIKAGPSFVPEREPQHEHENPFAALDKAYEELSSSESGTNENSLLDTGVQPDDQLNRELITRRQTSNEPLREVSSPVTPPNFGEGDVVVANGQEWSTENVDGCINGVVKPITCRVKGIDNAVITKGTASAGMSILDYFMWMFPIPHLSDIAESTNSNLRKRSLRCTSVGEILKFFGTLVLMTRCKFSDRRELWGESESSPVLGTPKFQMIISRTRFENLRSCIRFSRQHGDCTGYTEENQWQLCEDFVTAINNHKGEHVIPSEVLCVDESISRWYGLGGSWIDVGCPHYVKLDRKPEHGLEMQDVACGASGLLLGIKLVKSAEETQRISPATNENNGTKILLCLCEPWADRERIICADSYFASVEAAEFLIRKNLRFIGIVKTATSRYPIAHFGRKEFFDKGDFHSLSTKVTTPSGEKDVVAICWLDRNRRHFVSTAGLPRVTVAQNRVRWRQHNDGACPVEISVSMPELVNEYYGVAGVIDAHNRIRQDSLDLEKTVEVKEWSFRINCSLLGMVLVG